MSHSKDIIEQNEQVAALGAWDDRIWRKADGVELEIVDSGMDDVHEYIDVSDGATTTRVDHRTVDAYTDVDPDGHTGEERVRLQASTED